ncbi:uncharacterized protein FIBRA_05138 [Fibroporia radiculosa]|uniref:EF-hand domain-containing protein n=1 Tax=Fibroporia radiculosa TaxID=599839 RepID=J4IAJ5_9APHY|nr:uncharacterized protein FIBRA_05138 [Fibroporia radiculosa]CCM03021.1 predicted protein [Fibroporia radiculosa]
MPTLKHISTEHSNLYHPRIVVDHTQPMGTRPYRVDTDRFIKIPYVARAHYAPSIEHPAGSSEYSHKHKNFSVLQQHIIFWDRDRDGVIWPRDTFVGFRDLGFNVVFSLFAVFVINICFSLPTRLAHSYFPDPFFRVYVSSIHKDKHGSDSGVYDTEGRFVPCRFEDIFAKYSSKQSSTAPGETLSLREIMHLMHGQRVAVDPYGWSAAAFEWGTTWLLLQENGCIDKEDLRKLYDGSLFYEIREKRKTKEGWRKGWGLGGDGFVGGVKILPFSF